MGRGPEGAQGPEGPEGKRGEYEFNENTENRKIAENLPKMTVYIGRLVRELDTHSSFNENLANNIVNKNTTFQRKFIEYIVNKNPTITKLTHLLLDPNIEGYHQIRYDNIGDVTFMKRSLVRNANMVWCSDGSENCVANEVKWCDGVDRFDYELLSGGQTQPPGTACSNNRRKLFKGGDFNIGNILQVNGDLYVNKDLRFPVDSKKNGVRFLYENRYVPPITTGTPTGTPINEPTIAPTLPPDLPRYQEMISTKDHTLSLFADPTWKNDVTIKGNVRVEDELVAKDVYVSDDWHLFQDNNENLIIEYTGTDSEQKSIKIQPNGKVYTKYNKSNSSSGEDVFETVIKSRYPL
jgi:hypothetical protein